jgi:hypothetical protein
VVALAVGATRIPTADSGAIPAEHYHTFETKVLKTPGFPANLEREKRRRKAKTLGSVAQSHDRGTTSASQSLGSESDP